MYTVLRNVRKFKVPVDSNTGDKACLQVKLRVSLHYGASTFNIAVGGRPTRDVHTPEFVYIHC